MKKMLLFLLVVTVLAPGCARRSGPPVIRLGYFPNITHAQALVGMEEGRLAALVGAHIEPLLFKAGPYAMEALFAGEVDLLYVGPSPAVNGYIQSKGSAVRIIAGAMSGGALLVMRSTLPFVGPASLQGLRIAAPAVGNTQDVSLREYLRQSGVKANVITVAPADMSALFQRGDLDGAWVSEPWGSRLVHEAGVRIALDERSLWPDGRFATAVVVGRAEFLKQHPKLVRQFLLAHVEITRWIQANPAEAEVAIDAHLTRIVGKGLPPAVLRDAMARLEPTYDPLVPSILEMGRRAEAIGYPGRGGNFDSLFDLVALEEILRAEGLAPLSGSGVAP